MRTSPPAPAMGLCGAVIGTEGRVSAVMVSGFVQRLRREQWPQLDAAGHSEGLCPSLLLDSCSSRIGSKCTDLGFQASFPFQCCHPPHPACSGGLVCSDGTHITRASWPLWLRSQRSSHLQRLSPSLLSEPVQDAVPPGSLPRGPSPVPSEWSSP